MMVAAGCSSDGGRAPGERAVVVVTTNIWADIVENIDCKDAFDVATMIPPGSDPGGFEPSPAAEGRMNDAAIVVANGLFLEERFDAALDAAEDDGTPVFRAGDYVDFIAYRYAVGTLSHLHNHDEEGRPIEHDTELDHVGADPRLWFDPNRVAGVLFPLVEQLADATGVDEATLADCAARYQLELYAVDGEIADALFGLPADRRRIVTNHESIGYLGDRYGLEVIGAVVPEPAAQGPLSPDHLADLAELIDEAGVDTIFAEAEHPVDDAETLAERIGDVEIVTLYTDSLGPAGSGADTYLSFLRTNAELVGDALR